MKTDTQSLKTPLSLNYRRNYRGLIGVNSKVPVRDSASLSSVYTPGVGQVCLEIEKDPTRAHFLSCKGNSIALLSNGSSTNLGPYAVLPELESKSVLYKSLAGIDAFPLPLDTNDLDEIVNTLRLIQPTFGALHISGFSPETAIQLQQKLTKSLTIPFINADMVGSVVTIMAAVLNTLKVLDKEPYETKVIIKSKNGYEKIIADTLLGLKIADVTVCENDAMLINQAKGAHILIDLSTGSEFPPELTSVMAEKPAIITTSTLYNHKYALEKGAYLVVSAEPDNHNYINPTFALAGIIRAVLDTQSKVVNDEMLLAAACALSNTVNESQLKHKTVLPKLLDPTYTAFIAEEVVKSAFETGVNTSFINPEEIKEKVLNYIYEGRASWVPKPSEEELSPDTPIAKVSVDMHSRHQGVLEIVPRLQLKDNYIYNLLYSQVSTDEACRYIQENNANIYEITCKNNMAAVITNSTAVLGLGDIGATAGLPVMEGKCVLFKSLAGVDALPICIDSKDIDEIVRTIEIISPVFGGINLEDIAAPSCFEIENKLKERSAIPIFHDDQHGTAVVVLAGLINALKYTKKDKSSVKIVMNGAGAGSIAVAKLLLSYGVKNLIICDTKGAIYKGRTEGMNPFKDEIAEITNRNLHHGTLEDVIRAADVFIGLSKGNLLTRDMIRSMAPDPIIFALANPYPEIMPKDAYAAGAKVVATGRSDFPNQVNNSIAFPGIFRGVLDTRAKQITDEMKLAAAYALANLVKEDELAQDKIIIHALDLKAPVAVAEAVARCAIETGLARINTDPKKIAHALKEHLYEHRHLRSLYE